MSIDSSGRGQRGNREAGKTAKCPMGGREGRKRSWRRHQHCGLHWLKMKCSLSKLSAKSKKERESKREK